MLAIGYSPFWYSPPPPSCGFGFGAPPGPGFGFPTQMLLLQMLSVLIEMRYGAPQPELPAWANGNSCYCSCPPPPAGPPSRPIWTPYNQQPIIAAPERPIGTSNNQQPILTAPPERPITSELPQPLIATPPPPPPPAQPANGPEWVQLAQSSCGASVPFTNSRGQTEAVSIQNRDGKTYVKTEHGEFQVEFKGDFSPAEQSQAIARGVDYYTQVPPHFRGEVKKLKFHTEERDGGACVRWDEDDDQINFYGGLQGVEPQGFFREFGRFIGKNLHKEGTLERLRLRGGEPAPPGWGTAMEADGNFINRDRHDAGDDFADGWGFYMYAAMTDGGAHASARQIYGNRWGLIDQINAGA